MRLFELQHPFFRPLWRRVLVVAICLGWAVFELATGSPFWAIIFGALGATAVWQLFLTPWREDNSDEQPDE
jgi:hypothetical protein